MCTFVVRILYHMQVVGRTRCSRKLLGKSLGGYKVLHVSENCEFERFGGIFLVNILCFRCAARTVGHEFELYK